jgi:uncharacterized membrane protein YuzA (DUF378 family)
MKSLNLITLVLVIVGGVNWGLVGLLGFDLVATIFGVGSALSRIVYILVGVSAVWQLVPLVSAFGSSEPEARRGHSGL